MTNELSSYFDKCRCCYSSFQSTTNTVEIDRSIESRFHSVINIELKSSKFLSNRVCEECHDKLLMFYDFKKEVLAKQEKLYELLDKTAPVKLEDFSDENEPAIVIKTEDLGRIPVDADPPHDAAIILSHKAIRKSNTQFKEGKGYQTLDNTQVKNHACPDCPKFFSSKTKLNLHCKRMHNQTRKFKCDESDFEAHLRWNVEKHMKAQHLPPDTEDYRVCPDCGKVFKGTNKLNYHIKTKHLKVTKFSCDMCDFKSYGKYYIRKHISVHHLPLELRKTFNCDLCSTILTSKKGLKTHTTLKHSGGLRPHKCFCGKSYPLLQTLKSHIKITHGGERKFKCTHCDKDFPTNMQMKGHYLVIHGPKQEIPCDKCGKTFNSLLYLKNHMIHHKPPTFKCSYCERLFHLKKDLQEHQNSVHLGIKYNCPICNRPFQSTQGLRKHKKSHVIACNVIDK